MIPEKEDWFDGVVRCEYEGTSWIKLLLPVMFISVR